MNISFFFQQSLEACRPKPKPKQKYVLTKSQLVGSTVLGNFRDFFSTFFVEATVSELLIIARWAPPIVLTLNEMCSIGIVLTIAAFDKRQSVVVHVMA
jgi:hypothetical protein